jgi:hypothetical protein
MELGYDDDYGDRTSLKTYRGGSNWNGTAWPTSMISMDSRR